MSTSGELTRFTLPSSPCPTDYGTFSVNRGVGSLILGVDGALWFTNDGNNSIGRVRIIGGL